MVSLNNGWRSHPAVMILDEIFAKWDRKKDRRETLLSHTYQVLLALSDLMGQSEQVEDHREALFWSALLHDFGKIAQGFQRQLEDGYRWGERHEVLSLAFLDWILPSSMDNIRLPVALGILTHHREWDKIIELYPIHSKATEEHMIELVQEIPSRFLPAVRSFLMEVAPIWKIEMGFGERLWGGDEIPALDYPHFYSLAKEQILMKLRAADSYVHNLFRKRRIDREGVRLGMILRGAILLSDHRASAGYREAIRLTTAPQPKVLLTLGIDEVNLYPHQREAMTVDNTTLLIAPTGSGKTEAALLWAFHCRPSRLFYLLPYQASMNAMYKRLNRLFPNQVSLKHGRDLHFFYRQLMELERGTDKAEHEARKLKDEIRLNLFPIRISSPYQLLKAFFRMKGYEAEITQFAGARMIVDEVHAYDVTRTAMLVKMLGYLQREWNVSLLLMSATFPRLLREVLEEEIRFDAVIRPEDSFYEMAQRHRIVFLDQELFDQEAIQLILSRINRGENLLVVCNTIWRATQIYKRLASDTPHVHILLLHGKLHGRDRLHVEEEIMKRMSTVRRREGKQTVLVATQAVEVSLDVSFDVGFSDPAPIEALFQRMGRVNRNPFPPKEVHDFYIFSRPTRFLGIYREEEVVKAIEVLRSEGNPLIVDEQKVESWIDAVYTGKIGEEWMIRYRQAADRFQRAVLDTLVPYSACSDLAEQFYEQFDSVPVLPVNLMNEYLKLASLSRLEAEQLLVPVSRQYYLRHRIETERSELEGIHLVDVRYIPRLGLDVKLESEGD